MPRLTKNVPSYRKHRATGQAVVTIAGRDHYLGPWKSKASRVEYDRLVGEWIANGRQPVLGKDQDATIVELAAAFLRHAKQHYTKNGRPTDELAGMKLVLRYLRQSYGHSAVADFRPLCLEAIRNKMIEAGNCRGYINQNISRIKHIFKWGVAKELVPETTYRALATLEGLHAGKSDARESDPVLPVDNVTVEATLKRLPPHIADMVKLQRLTGMRPGEVVLLRPADVDRSGAVWQYRPEEHKMQHKGRERVILIGPKGQAILLPHLLRDGKAYCFAPKRQTKLGRYTAHGYRDAIHRACAAAGLDEWSPNQLRHSAATDIRKRFGLEAAQVTLGHAKMDVTQIYAERDMEKAAAVVAQVG